MKYFFSAYIAEKQRVDMYISALFSDFSRSYIQKLIDKGFVKVNGKVVKKNIKIIPRDSLEITIKLDKSKIDAEDIPLEVIYEDDDMILINKEAGMNVHPVPGENGTSGTLVNAILHHTKNNLPTIGGEERPGIVHRLDKDTSGIILIAKNDISMRELQKIIHERKIEKYYIAIVNGKIKEKTLKIESNIGRHMTDKIKMTAHNPINPKYALSYVEVLGYIDNEYSLLKVKIETGRTHQIRVHLSSIGFPIIGDRVYGNKQINENAEKKFGLKRQALHAYELGFTFFGTPYHFIAPLKDDMKIIIGKNYNF